MTVLIGDHKFVTRTCCTCHNDFMIIEGFQGHMGSYVCPYCRALQPYDKEYMYKIKGRLDEIRSAADKIERMLKING